MKWSTWFSAGLIGLGLLANANAAATAGKDYEALPKAQATEAPGKVEVVEFFWYGCPHCYHLDDKVKAWESKLPKDVSFRREHAMWDGRSDMAGHVKLFVALKALGQQNKLNSAVFKAVHADKVELRDADKAADWAAKQGIGAEQFKAAYNSFSAQSQFARTMQQTHDYRVDSVPVFVVNGKYKTSPAMANSEERTFEVLDELIAQERASLKPVAKAKAKK